MSNAPYSYEFYEQCARENKIYDTPEFSAQQIKGCQAELDKLHEPYSKSDWNKWLYWQLRKTVIRLREHESGRHDMSDYAVIHNTHVGLSEILSFPCGENLLKD